MIHRLYHTYLIWQEFSDNFNFIKNGYKLSLLFSNAVYRLLQGQPFLLKNSKIEDVQTAYTLGQSKR